MILAGSSFTNIMLPNCIYIGLDKEMLQCNFYPFIISKYGLALDFFVAYTAIPYREITG